MSLTPNIAMADNFLSKFDFGAFDFRTFADNKSSAGLVSNFHGELSDHEAALAKLNAKGAGIYFTVNRTNGKGRSAGDVEHIRALFIDFDAVDHDRVALLLETCLLSPSVIVESSKGKHHAYWILSTEGEPFPKERFTEAQKALIQHFEGADPVIHDLPRIMRLPGFYHVKTEPFMTQVVHNAGVYYTANELLSWINTLAGEPKASSLLSPEYSPQPRPLVDYYAKQAMENAETQLMLSSNGDRNNTLNKEAFGLFGLVKAGRITNEEVWQRLKVAALSVGLSKEEIGITLRSAYNAAQPRYEGLPSGDTPPAITRYVEGVSANGMTGVIPPLVPLIPDIEKPAPYPMESLPPLMRDAAKAIAQHVMAPLPLAAACVVGAVTHLAQTRVNAPSADGRPEGMPCSLFMLTLADSGDRKSACRKLAFNEIDKEEKRLREAHAKLVRDYEKAIQGMSDKDRRAYEKENAVPFEMRTIYGSDASFSRIVSDLIKALSAASWDTDEGGAMFGGHSMKSETRAAVLGGLVQLFDTGRAERDRSRDNADGSGIAYDRRFSMMLLAQEITVRDALSDPLLRGQGFLPRFLFSGTESLAGQRFRTVNTDDKAAYKDRRLQAFWERCRVIMAKPPYIDVETLGVTAMPADMDAGALEVWTDFYNEVEGAQAPLQRFSEMKPFAGRAGELARRLAAVFSYFDGKGAIDKESMSWACSVVRFSLSEWARYTNAVHVPLINKQASEFMQWALDPKRADDWRTFTKDKFGKSAPQKLRKAGVRDAVLDLLVTHNHLITDDGKTFTVSHAARDFGVYAETAEVAETQQLQGAQVAETLRRDAEVLEVILRDGGFSAEFRNHFANEMPANTRLSAVSAESAGDIT